MSDNTHIMVVATECEVGHEAEFHEWYETEHIPDLLAIPGIVSARRFASLSTDGSNRWLAIYELDGDLDEIRARLAASTFHRSPYYLRELTESKYYTALPAVTRP